MALKHSFYVVWFIAAFYALTAHAQKVSSTEFKTALVGQIIKNTVWPDLATNEKIKVVVPEDKAMAAALSRLETVRIQGRGIEVRYASGLDRLSDAELVYISKNAVSNLDQALAFLRGKGILVVTENSPTLHNVMINIVENVSEQTEDYHATFQINRPNIVFENLRIKPELILHGGTELDVAELYRATELAMQELREQNVASIQTLETQRDHLEEQKATLEKQRKILRSQSDKLQNMTSRTQQLTRELNQNKQLLAAQRKALKETNAKLAQANQEYQDVQQEYQDVQQEYEDKIRQINEALSANQQKVDSQLSLLTELESQVAKKTQLLEDKDEELKRRTKLLAEKEAKLIITSNQLEQKSAKVANQAELITRQHQIIAAIVAIAVVFAIAIFMISKLLIKNKRITKRLTQTNLSLEEAMNNLEHTQAQLVESEKLASLGQLVSGVAHEINTPIGVAITASSAIGDNAKLHLKLLEEHKLRKKDVETFLASIMKADGLILSNLERCAKLVQSFKQISADQIIAEDRHIKLKDYMSSIMGTLSITLKRNHVKWTVEGDNPEHYLDPGLLAQVISNLVTNALNYAFKGQDARSIQITIRQDKDYSEIAFSDNGKGMDEETKNKIFDPFFTTARGSGGTGLGMNIVYNLVTSKLHGTIQVESQLNEGTTVRITLPR